VRSYFLLAVLFLFITGWLFLFHPFEVKEYTKSAPQLQIEKFVFKLLTPKGEDLWLKAQKGIKQKDILKIWDVEVRHQDERLLAKKGSYSGQLLRLHQDVRYQKRDLKFRCNLALYHILKKLLKVRGTFELHTPTMYVTGKELFYNQKVGTIRAKDIEAVIKSL